MTWLIIFVCLIPTLVEAYLDRRGETKTGKKKDTLWLVIATAVLLGLCWWLFDINPIGPGLLVLGWRVLVLDYLVNILLYRNKVIENPGAEKWWSYMGKSTHFWDQALAKIDWRIRLAARVLLFSGTMIGYKLFL